MALSLYQPSYMSPRNSTIDANIDEEMVFSCQLNGNSILYGYDILMYNPDTNDLVFQLTSAASKKTLQTSLDNAKKRLQQIESDISTREGLLKQLSQDTTDETYQNELNQMNTECLAAIVEMRECLSGERQESEFFTLGDSIKEKINQALSKAKTMQTRIETYYLAIIEKFQKRISNNSIQINANIQKYEKVKAAKQVVEATVTTLEKLIRYAFSNISTNDTSTKRILMEYWGDIAETVQGQMNELRDNKKDTEAEISRLQTAVDNLDDGMFVLDKPLYPVDYQGKNVILSHQIPAGTLKNGQNYKWKFILYWSSTNDKENLDQSIDSQECYFECRTTPVVDISNFEKKINKRFYEFQGEYIQEQHVPVTYFRWILTNLITGEVLKDTGYIPSPDIRFYYDVFLNDYRYSIQLFVRNQNDIEVQTDPMEFKVSYVQAVVDNVVTAQSNTEEHGIIVSWSGVHGITPNIYGDYEYMKDLPVKTHTSLRLPKGSSLVFDKDNGDTLKIPATTATHIISTRIDDPTDEILYEATGTNGGLEYHKRLTLEGNDLVYNINDIKEYRWTIEPSPLYWYVIFMLPDRLIVSKKWASGLFPAEDLYPHFGLYPEPLVYHNTEGEVLI